MHKRAERSLLYGLPLRGRGTGAVESTRSYLQRLAFAHQVTPSRLVDELVRRFPLASTGAALAEKVNELNVSGVGQGVRQLRERLEWATREDLSPSCMDRFGHVLSPQRLTRRVGGFHCQECVREFVEDDLPYGQLLWELPVVCACPIHKVRLTSSALCQAPSRRLPLNARPNLAGVCRACGSIGFRCVAATPTPASDAELWIAGQAAELVALPAEATASLSPASVRGGVGQVVEHRFGGSPVKASLGSGLARATVLTWLHSSLLPSLDSLLRLCLASKASLVDLLSGRYHALPAPDAIGDHGVTKRGYRRLDVDWLKVREALVREASAVQPRSIEAVATEFGSSPRQLRQKLPAETRALGQRTMSETELRAERLARDLEAKYEAAAHALARDGLTVSTKALQERSGLRVFASRNRVRARVLRAVVERFRADDLNAP